MTIALFPHQQDIFIFASLNALHILISSNGLHNYDKKQSLYLFFDNQYHFNPPQ